MSRADDLARLRDEMSALREARFTFVRDVKSFVAGLLGSFRSAHAEMADRTRGERTAFVSRLRATVADLRRQFADENAAAHRAWWGGRGDG